MSIAPLQLPGQFQSPSVDLAGSLSQLGQVYKQAQTDQLQKQMLATGDPEALIRSGDLSLAQIGATMKNRLADEAWRQQEAARQGSQFQQTLELQRRTADRLDQTPEEKAAERIKAAKVIGLQPGTAEHTQYLANGSISEANVDKPYPVDTLSGTKFMVRKPGGGFTLLDPSVLAAPQFAAAAQPGAQPTAAPSPGPQVASAAPGSFADRFAGAQGGPAAAAQPDMTEIDPTTGRRESWLKSQAPDAQEYIKKIANYEIDPRTSSTKGGHRERLMSAVASYDPTYNQNEFGTRAKAMRDFATGVQGNAVRSFDVAIDHLDTLQKYSDALKSGDMRLINRIRNEWLGNTGSPLPTNVQAIAPIVGAEVTKAVIGSNNALADREELRKPLQIANSPEQISGAIQGYKGLMAGQLKGLRKQYEDTTGKKDFDTRVRENTRKVLLGESAAGGTSSGPVKIDGYTIKEN